MRIHRQHSRHGIALIIVMIVIVVFGILAGGFAYSMKVETTLARNANWDTELEWLGRSGIEMAKCFLSQSSRSGQQYDALNQLWAGGTGETNDALAGFSLENNELGHGKFSVKIVDADRKFNVNLAQRNPEILRQGLILIGTDAAESTTLVNAILDWVDPDDDTHVGSTDTESDYYLTLKPPYRAKNGPIDDLSELLMVRGVTPEMYWGSGKIASSYRQPARRTAGGLAGQDQVSYPIGFVDLFTAISGPTININTASATVLQVVPDVDENMAQAIVTTRAGPDGAEGNEDDMPFRSIGELSNVPGMNRAILGQFSRYFNVRSTTFEVRVEVQIDQYKRTYFALLRRNGRDLQTLYTYWR